MHYTFASYWEVAGRILRQRQADRLNEAEQKQPFAGEIKIRLTRGVEIVGGGSGADAELEGLALSLRETVLVMTFASSEVSMKKQMLYLC